MKAKGYTDGNRLILVMEDPDEPARTLAEGLLTEPPVAVTHLDAPPPMRGTENGKEAGETAENEPAKRETDTAPEPAAEENSRTEAVLRNTETADIFRLRKYVMENAGKCGLQVPRGVSVRTFVLSRSERELRRLAGTAAC